MMGAMLGYQFSDADRLILEAATGARRLTKPELQQIVDHLERARFDPYALERVRGRLAGLTWKGQTLKGTDRLPPAEVKCLWQ